MTRHAPVATAASLAGLCDAAGAAARNLGLTEAPARIAPEHWQRVLAAVEARSAMRGVALPAGWREDLAEQMGRTGPDAHTGPES